MQVDEVIKLGGSVVTRKDRACCADLLAVRALGAALARSPCGRLLVHGTGSFGKPWAIRYDYLDGRFDARLLDRYLEIRNSLADLARIVARELARAGLPVAELDAYGCFPRGGEGRLAYGAPEHVALLLKRGAVPLFHGDLYVSASDGFRVVSSDDMAVELARHFRPRRVVFLTDVAGVLDPSSGETIIGIAPESAAASMQASPDRSDVSGGMAAKLRAAFEAARHAGECWIADGRDEAVLEALAAGAPLRGTRVRPGAVTSEPAR